MPDRERGGCSALHELLSALLSYVRSEQSFPCQFWKHVHMSYSRHVPWPEQPFGQSAEAVARPARSRRSLSILVLLTTVFQMIMVKFTLC